VSASRPNNDPAGLTEDFYERLRDRLYRRVARALEDADLVVELGCGSCGLARFLAERNGQDVVGVDVSDAGFPHEAAGQHVSCRKADARNMAFLPDGSAAGAVTMYALHEMEDPVAALGEARRVLAPGGRIVIVDFPAGSLAHRLWGERYYSPDRVREMLREAGFHQVRVRLIESAQLIWATARAPGRRGRATDRIPSSTKQSGKASQ